MTDQFITQRERCTWVIESQDEDGNDTSHECGRLAVTIYSKPNPRAREPNQPTFLRYPRCATHDTNEARRVAPTQGYDVEELSHDT